MSIGKEILDDYAYELYHLRKEGIWVTKEGKEIPIVEMTVPHIKNCMKMVGESSEWYEIFKSELNRRNKILASYSLHGEIV